MSLPEVIPMTGIIINIQKSTETSGIPKQLLFNLISNSYVFTGFASPCNDIGGVASLFQ